MNQIFYSVSDNTRKQSRVMESDDTFVVEYIRNGRKVYDNILLKDKSVLEEQKNHAINMAKMYVE